jgi:hypothetical protein
MSKTYIAYGSNMDMAQMKHRCPHAKLVDVGTIPGYQLLFKGSGSGAYATIEKKKGSAVPAYIWHISSSDEERLDRYEGYPIFYYKTRIQYTSWNGSKHTGMVYIMHEDRELGAPTREYFNILADAYDRYGWDKKILHDALQVTFDAWEREAKE